MIKKLKSKLKLSELVKKSCLSFSLRVVGMCIGYIFTLLIANYYGAEVIGLYTLSFVFLQMVSIISRLGMDMALLKLIPSYYDQKNIFCVKKLYFMVLRLIFPFSILLSVIAFFISPYVAKYIFEKEYLASHLQLASLGVLPYTMIFIHSESLRGLHKIKEYMFLKNILTTLVGSIIIFILFNLIDGYEFKPIFILVISIYITFIASIWIWKKSFFSLFKGIKYSVNSSKPLLSYRNLLSIALPMTLTAYIEIVMGSTDTVMLGMYATEKAVGIYSIVIKLTSLSMIIYMAVYTFITPKFSVYWTSNNTNSLRQLSKSSTKLILYTSLPIFIIIWIFPEQLLGIFGVDFKQGVTALIIITVGQLLLIISGPVWPMMNMTNKQRVFFYFSILSAVVNVVLNYLLIPIYGLNGAALSTVIGLLILNILCVFYIKKEFGLLTLYLPFSKG